MRRRSALWTLAVSLCALTLVVGGCSSGGDASENTTTTVEEESTSSTSTTTTIAVPVPDPRVVDEVAISAVPDGFTPDPQSFVSGSFDIDKAVSDERVDDQMQERSTLFETRGFVSGFSRGWSNTVDDTITVLIYDFATAEGASRDLGDGRSLLPGRGAVLFEVPEVPNAVGFTFSLPATAEYAPFTTQSVAFTRGTAVPHRHRWVHRLASETTRESRRLVRRLAEAQLRLLKAADDLCARRRRSRPVS